MLLLQHPFIFVDMKNTILIIFGYIIALPLFSQTFERFLSTNEDEFVYDAVNINDSELLFAYNFGETYTNYQTKVYKMNTNNGLFSDSTMITFNYYEDYYFDGISEILTLNDSIYILVGNAINKVTNDNQLFICHLNTNLELIYDTLTGDVLENDIFYDHIIDQNSNLICVGKIDSDKTFFKSRNNERMLFSSILIEKTTKSTDILLVVYDLYGNQLNKGVYPSSAGLASTIFEIPQENSFHVYNFWDNNHSFNKINSLSLEIDSTVEYPSGFLPRMSFPSFNDENYFVTGRQGFVENQNVIYYLSYLVLDFNGVIIDQQILNSDSTIYYTFKTFEATPDNIVFAGEIPFVYSSPWFFYPENRWILFYKLNISGNIIWQKFYKGEVHYTPYKIITTADGGTVVFSTKYDWNDIYPNQRDVHILKIDSDGNYIPVGLTEPQKNDKQILIYPNPATDKIHINLGLFTDLTINIYDINGCLEYESLLKHSSSIDLKSFKPGVYIYKVFKNNEFIENGKFIKQ